MQYDYEIIENYENNDNATCPITCEIIKECIKTICGHIFSKEGFEKYMNDNEYIKCPICRKEIKNHDYQTQRSRTPERGEHYYNFSLYPERNQPQGTANFSRGGGLMQLVAYGAQDVYLTSNPQITTFRTVYRRHFN